LKQVGRPKYQKLNGEDQKAFILSVNINRRHMTAGQRWHRPIPSFETGRSLEHTPKG